MTDSDSVPEWWRENEAFREAMGLPSYEPPRFEDGIYAYEVTKRIEAEQNCHIRFLGVNARYRDDWEVRVDGETAFEIGRRRDDNGNTIYRMTAEQFEEAIENHLDEAERDRD